MTEVASMALGASADELGDDALDDRATGMPAMNDATMADQNMRRDRARARRVDTGRSTMRPPRTVIASVRRLDGRRR